MTRSMSRYPQDLLSPAGEGGKLSLLGLDTGDGSIKGLLTRVDSLETEDGLDLGLMLGKPGDVGDGVGGVGQGDGLVLSDHQLLLGGEGCEVDLRSAEGHRGQEEDTSYIFHHLITDKIQAFTNNFFPINFTEKLN